MYGYSLEIINRIFLLKKIIIYEIKKYSFILQMRSYFLNKNKTKNIAKREKKRSILIQIALKVLRERAR